MASFGSGNSKQEVRELEQFERQRAAIETVFTFALLYIAGLQVWTTVHHDIDFWLAIVPVLLLTAIALIIGGENLLEQLRNGLWKRD